MVDSSTENVVNSVKTSPEADQLVFVNGYYTPELSVPPKEIVALPLEEALLKHGDLLSDRTRLNVGSEKDPLVLLNYERPVGGLFIHIPPKSISKFKIVHLVNNHEADVMMLPRIHLFISYGSNVCFEYVQHGDCFVTSLLDISLDDEASCHTIFHMQNKPKTIHLDAIRATLKRNSSFTSCVSTNGSLTARQDYNIKLIGENAKTCIYGLGRIKDKCSYQVSSSIHHEAPNTYSWQHFKNVIEGSGSTSFCCDILIQKEAKKAVAFQLNNNLLLGQKAVATCMPKLRVYTDDVKASHGATFGKLDENQLFYLKTRGIGEKNAKKLLVDSFCMDMVNKFEECNVGI